MLPPPPSQCIWIKVTCKDMDLHVSIGGRVCMVHTATMHGNIQRAFDFTLHPLDPSRVLVAGDHGKLVHGSRLTGTQLGTLPLNYVVQPHVVDVVAVAVHPFVAPSPCAGLILSACADGLVTLHHVECSNAICFWDIKARCLVGPLPSSSLLLQIDYSYNINSGSNVEHN